MVDEDLFLKYLESPVESDFNVMKANVRVMPKNDNIFISHSGQHVNLTEILQLCLEQQKNTSGKVFEKYFENKDLEKMVFMTKF